jgi:CRP/FNR family cyclic AMP-dependent transcriptional regulator
MKETPYDKYPKDKIKTLLAGIPFFNDLSMKDSAQHQLLLKHSAILELSGGDVLIAKGAVDRHYYFLLKGELAVYADKDIDRKSVPVSRLAQGQVLGALAVITGLPRTATVALEKGSSDALVFSADTSLFGELENFSSVSLATKLALYRNVINNTRFKLEGYKAKNPKHPVTEEYIKLPKFVGEKDALPELQYCAQQAIAMARLLQKWNEL